MKLDTRILRASTSELIWERGKAYFQDGMVEEIAQTSNCFTAQVEGSGDAYYTVEVHVAEDGAISQWHCDCPYDGVVCKHVVAVVLEIEDQGLTSELPKDTSLETLIKGASRQQLEDLVLQTGQKNRGFAALIRLSLEPDAQAKITAIKAYVSGNKLAFDHKGYPVSESVSRAYRSIGAMVCHGQSFLEQGLYDEAYEITSFLLSACLGVYNLDATYSREGDKVRQEVIAQMTDLIEHIASDCPVKAAAVVEQTLTLVQQPNFDYCEEERYKLIAALAVLLDGQSLATVLAVMADLLDEDECREELDGLVRYRLVIAVEGAQAGQNFLYANLHCEPLCQLAVEDALARQEYAVAERICQEKCQAVARQGVNLHIHWQQQLSNVYQASGAPVQTCIDQLKTLVLLGKIDCYDQLKALLIEAKQWEQEEKSILDEIAKNAPRSRAVTLFATQNATDHLWEMISGKPLECLQYGQALWSDYSQELKAIFKDYIEEKATIDSNRSDYGRTAHLLEQWLSVGDEDGVKAVIEGLKRRYPKRVAMQGILQDLEKRHSL